MNILNQFNTAESNLLSQIEDIEGIVYSPWANLITNLIYVLIGIILLVIIIFLIRKIKNKIKDPKPIPPDQVFFNRIKKLKKLKLIESEEFRVFYLELSEIYRNYLSNRYDYPAIDKTTEEIISEFLPHSEIDENLKRKTIDFLRRADLIKFANGTAKIEDAKSDIEQLTKIVLKTKKIETLQVNPEAKS